MASLRIVGADGAEKIVELREGKVQIGRGRDNDVVLADQEKGVSRTHAELRFENGRYIIVDLQSQNGTWLNGRRVERGEVPPGAEITIGDYRLTIRKESPPSTMNVTAGATIARPVRDLGDLQIRERVQAPAYHAPPPRVQPARTAPQAPPPQRNMVVAVLVVAAAVVLFGTVAYIFTPGGGGASPARAVEPAPTEPRPPEPSAASTPEAAPVAERAPDGAEPATGKPNAPRHTPPNRKPDRVARKPGESLETWRTRSEALETRYSYSKQALDRRDFAAAAGGFQAILLEEPGFLDAPQLLVQANAGLRATANGLFESGKRMNAAGDWVGALQKFEQARAIYSAIPGINDAIQDVRAKLRAAGTRAFAQAKQLEATGRTAEAVKEYEKAVQWLATDDPNRQAARARLEQLKRTQ